MTRPDGTQTGWCEECRAVVVHDVDRLSPTRAGEPDAIARTCRGCGLVSPADPGD